MPPKISLISVNYNQPAITVAFLESVKRQAFQDIEVILVDNASKENCAALFQSVYPNLIFIRSEENLGFAGGNNLGIAASSGEFLFFVNNDTELTVDAIEKMLSLFNTIPNLGIVSPKLYYYLPERTIPLLQYVGATNLHPVTGRNKMHGRLEEEKGLYDDIKPTYFAHGAAMMIPRKVIEQVGQMPDFFFLYFEELDWCEQIRRAGYEIYIQPKAAIYHKESTTVGQLSLIRTYYMTRNRILFMRRNKPAWSFFLFSVYVFCISTPKHLIDFLSGGHFDHIRVYFKALWWNYSWKR